MRVRHIAALTVAVLVAGVVTFQAFTATPPQPYVRLIGDGRPNAPWMRTECREDGHFWEIYTTSRGEEIVIPTSFDCPY
jgi:hypothetical protein